MSYYLLENHVNLPDGKLPWYTTRWTCRHGVQGAHLLCLHTPETLPDYDPPDFAAENVAKYGASTTRASWHWTVDSDSIIPMMPYTYTAWHVRDYNRCGIGIEIGARASDWPTSPDWWDDATIYNAARAVLDAVDYYQIPARLITKEQADRGESGVIGHRKLDPTRRSDPGEGFPFEQFLSLIGDDMLPPAWAEEATQWHIENGIYSESSTSEVDESYEFHRQTVFRHRFYQRVVDPAIARQANASVPDHDHKATVTLT